VNDATGVPALTARIEAGPRGGVVAALIVVEPDGRRFARRLEAPSCAAATDAVALVVAITLDPSAATGEASAAAGTTGRHRRGGQGTAAAGTTSPTPTPTPEPPRAAAARCGKRDGDAASAGAGHRRLTAGVAAAAVVGPAPTADAGHRHRGAGGARSRLDPVTRRWCLTLSHVWSGGQMEPGGIAAFTLDLVALDACPVRVALLAWKRAPAPRVAGRLAAGVEHLRPGRWPPVCAPPGDAAPGVLFGSRVEAPGPVRGRGDLVARCVPFSPEVFHRVASVTLVGDVGIGVRFP
jgi:hypothetical protein